MEEARITVRRQLKPLIVEIPDRHGQHKIGETIDKYVSDAIGVKL